MIYIQGDGSHMHSLTAYFFYTQYVPIPQRAIRNSYRGEDLKSQKCQRSNKYKAKMKLLKGWGN